MRGCFSDARFMALSWLFFVLAFFFPCDDRIVKALQEPSVRSRDASGTSLPLELELEDISMALANDKGSRSLEMEETEDDVRTVRRGKSRREGGGEGRVDHCCLK